MFGGSQRGRYVLQEDDIESQGDDFMLEFKTYLTFVTTILKSDNTKYEKVVCKKGEFNVK